MEWLQQLYDLFGTTYDYPYTDYQQINLDFVFSALVALKNAIMSLKNNIIALQSDIENSELHLVYTIDVQEDSEVFDIYLSESCQELYMQFLTEPDVDNTSADVIMYSDGRIISRYIMSSVISATTRRITTCRIVSLSLAAVIEYTTAQSGAVTQYRVVQTVVAGTAAAKKVKIDRLRIARSGGNSKFKSGTKIRIYGR